MKHVLKGWLVDNSVTADDKTDKILRLESAGNLGLSDILEAMKQEDTGLRQETINHVVSLYHRVLADRVLSGYAVNAELFYMTPEFRGVIQGGAWDPEENSIYVSIRQGKALRDAIRETGVEILGERQGVMYIASGEDAATRTPGYNATAGRNFILNGRMLKVTGDDPAVGITLTDAEGAETRLAEDMLVVNNPSQLILLIPANLPEGDYTLTVTMQYSGTSTPLKTPRSVSQMIFISLS